MQRFLDFIWTALKLALIVAALYLGSCAPARTILSQAPLKSDDQLDFRPISRSEEDTLDLFEREIYGQVRGLFDLTLDDEETLEGDRLEDAAIVTQWRVVAKTDQAERAFDLVIVRPKTDPTALIVLSQNFCPNHNVVPIQGVRAPTQIGFDCSGGGLSGLLMSRVFGRYIVSPPLEDILAEGYGFAALYPSQVVADSRRQGLSDLEALFGEDRPNMPGALATWAALSGELAPMLKAEYDSRAVIAYGHSRYGKTALIAGAYFPEIDGVIAHQSGTLGASRLTDGMGEPLSAIIESYPHWPGENLRTSQPPANALVGEPADLMAAITPKPLLLGNARRDVWSDPYGAFVELQRVRGADAPIRQPGDFVPSDPLAYWIRPGTHGVVKEDWPAFLAFMEAHFE